jgi:ATP synthase F1 delta subunit
MEMLTVARRYARALILLDQDEELKALLADLCQLWCQPMVVALIDSLAVPGKHKSSILIELFNPLLPIYQQNFIKLLCEKQRFNCIIVIAEVFNQMLAFKNGVAFIKLEVAERVNLVEDKVLAQLEHSLHTKIDLKIEKDNALLGGARISMGEHILDGSIKYMLEKLHITLSTY